ncbi:MAG: hypothetical protein GX552_04110 [Chloroflexi bacterium]|nr:hypothetical protein [Chloroflexota bacterium]
MITNDLTHAAGDLALTLVQVEGGILLRGLADTATQRALLIDEPLPLFQLTLRHVGTAEEKTLVADGGWQYAHVARTAQGFSAEWARPDDAALAGVRVQATATADAKRHAWRWKLQVENTSADWSLRRVVFPQLALSKPGDDGLALVPAGPGQLREDAWETAFSQVANYPAGWMWGLQFLAAYATKPAPTGLYVGIHDPYGSVKDLQMEGDPTALALRLTVDHPVPNMGRPGNPFFLQGEAVWQLLRGDWFDAAVIYRDWASKNARWWPRLGAEGREDTPLWMRELSLWAQGGSAEDQAATIGPVRQLREYMGIPLGFHWYCWHQIPFDNDYPHYFPALPWFVDGVRELQEAGVRVMPYINGRLWDTRDRGAEDFEFSRVALPAATKGEDGQPYIEAYGSKEADGSPVQLAPMCPTTPLWQERVRELVTRLFADCGVDGVYIDQIAAAEARLCMDPNHGHPLGGGHWWNEGYWRMLDAIRAKMPQDRMITSECNAEVFTRWFDGFLTWHWQLDRMVPAWPAVYGGVIQMFGRSYGSAPEDPDEAKALAWRMHAGQQFVFGEQIGWFNASQARDPMPMEFIRAAAQLRWRLRRYFYAGEMARPPRLRGDNPRVRANWNWFQSEDNPWVTTESLMSSAWQMRGEPRLVLLFANVSDDSLHCELLWDGAAYGIPAPEVQATRMQTGEPDETYTLRNSAPLPMTFAPRQVMALEVRW